MCKCSQVFVLCILKTWKPKKANKPISSIVFRFVDPFGFGIIADFYENRVLGFYVVSIMFFSGCLRTTLQKLDFYVFYRCFCSEGYRFSLNDFLIYLEDFQFQVGYCPVFAGRFPSFSFPELVGRFPMLIGRFRVLVERFPVSVRRFSGLSWNIFGF